MKVAMLLLSVFVLFLESYSQQWQKKWERKTINLNSDSLLTQYLWEVRDEYHAFWSEISLFKNGRYKYLGYLPISFRDSSEGFFNIHKDTLTLNSDFQPNKVPVKVNYVDTSISGRPSKIYFPTNQRGNFCYMCSYYFNNDTSVIYYPRQIENGDVPKNLSSLKILFYGNDFTSDWVNINEGGKFIQVIILDYKNFDDYRNRVFNNVKFKIEKSKLIGIARTDEL